MEDFDSIVLSGGGPNGLATLGVLHYYFQKNKIDTTKIKELAGTSIGSVICLLLACGYTPIEILSEMCMIDNFFDFKQTKNIIHNIKNMGAISIDPFINKISELLIRKTGEIYTFQKLFDKTGKILYISATNVTDTKEIKYFYKTHPNLSCLEAVKQSCNIPVIFHKIVFEGKCISDGGVSNNYPWDYISESSVKTLGVFIEDNTAIFDGESFLGYIYNIIVTPIRLLSEIRCNMAPGRIKTVRLKCKKSDSYLNIEQSRKMEIFISGYKQAEEYDSIIKLTVMNWEQAPDKNYIFEDDELWEDF